MSFFRFLVGLLIAAGVGFGLYKLTLDQGLGGDTTLRTTPQLSGETTAVRAPIEEPEQPASSEAQSFTERTEAAVNAADAQETQETPELTITRSEPAPEAPSESAPETATEAAAETASETAPAAVETETETETETSAAAATAGSTEVLGTVTSGMNYAEARQAMVDAGWQPRSIDAADRTGIIKDSEQALLTSGYEELEGCSDAARPICRFEFIDGGDRIAAVITAGADSDPSVIDAFLMNVRP